MKAVILAGGLGTRIAEESHMRPKPMIEIGGRPILWHVMNIYTSHGVTDFIVCLGYRGYMIKEYFANYVLHESDLTVDARSGEIIYHTNYAEPWRVTLVDTGVTTMTGGRLKRVGRYLDPDECFCMTYGDGVADIDITGLIAFHRKHGKLATLTAVAPPGRYGALLMQDDSVTQFTEKPPGDHALINGGFFVLLSGNSPGRNAAGASHGEQSDTGGSAAQGWDGTHEAPATPAMKSVDEAMDELSKF